MPKEVVVNAWCDPCYRDGVHTPGEEVTLALGDLARFKPQVMLLCEPHRKEFYEPIRELLEEYGAATGTDASTPVPAKRRSSTRTRSAYGPYPEGEWPCPYPDCDRQDLPNKEALQRHIRMVHGVTLGDFLAQRGDPATPKAPTSHMPLRAIPEQGVPMYCPMEDCSLSRSHDGPSKNKRALAAHFPKRHGAPMGEWFRDHPEVDPESLCQRESDQDTLV